MRIRAGAVRAVIGGLVLLGAARLPAQEVVEVFDDGAWDAQQAAFNQVVGSTSFGGAGGVPQRSGYLAADLMTRPIQLVAGVEYLYARANFSEALAYVQQDVTSVEGGENWIQYDFDYDSSYSVYGGVYLCDCGGSVIFDFNRLQSDASFAAVDTNQFENFGRYEVNGDIEGSADVDLKSYDLSFSKTIPLGTPLACGGCDSCGPIGCDSCVDGCVSCPAWDITWSGGIRYAEVEWGRGATSFDRAADDAVIDSYQTRMDFDGFGGRLGLAGRRYIGPRGMFSLYAKGDWSLLVGDITVNTVVSNLSGDAFMNTSCNHVVPVTEIELGGTIHVGCHANITAGYFWSAWHDLGMRDTYFFNQFQTSHFDDANILGWDGLFVRGEVAF